MRIIQTLEDINQIKRECMDKVKFYVDLANSKIGVDMPYPLVKFDINGTTGGTATFNRRDPKKSFLRFNPTLLRENVDHFLQQTVGHEVAHLVARLKAKEEIDPHGSEWARVMWAFSLPATRCHNYDVSNVPTQMGKSKGPSLIVRPPQRNELGTVKYFASGKVIELD